jgi:hypothetical protein
MKVTKNAAGRFEVTDIAMIELDNICGHLLMAICQGCPEKQELLMQTIQRIAKMPDSGDAEIIDTVPNNQKPALAMLLTSYRAWKSDAGTTHGAALIQLWRN